MLKLKSDSPTTSIKNSELAAVYNLRSKFEDMKHQLQQLEGRILNAVLAEISVEPGEYECNLVTEPCEGEIVLRLKINRHGKPQPSESGITGIKLA